MNTWRKVGCCLAIVAGLAFGAGMSFAAAAAEPTTVNNWSELLAAVSTASDGDVIILAAGDYTVVDSGVTLSHGVTVRGATGDPADVTITDAVSGKCAFTITHADARIEAMTITGAGMGTTSADSQKGGHLNLSSGTVRNCVIEGGKVSLTGNRIGGRGGNVYMTGGVVEDSILRNGSVGRQGCGGNIYMAGGIVRRCEIRDGVASSDANNKTAYSSAAAGVYASAGLIDSCLLVDNKVTRNGYCGGMYLSGTATAVNCTVVGSRVDDSATKSDYYLQYGFGVQIASTTAKAINTVMYDNGGDAQKEYGTANLGNYVNCASTIDNESDVGWQTIDVNDFTAYGQGDYTLPLTSKLVDAGTLAEGVYPADASTTDLLGQSRVSRERIDIGCYETEKSQFSFCGSLSAYAVHEGEEVLCSAVAAGLDGDIRYKWNFGNGTVITTDLADFAYAYPDAGLFTVSVSASGDGETWTEPFVLGTKIVVVPSVMYVDSENANPSFPYKGKSSASTTITAVLNAMTNNVSEGRACVPGVEIRLVEGSRLTESGIVLDEAIVIRGESDDPEAVTIVDAVEGKRAFTLNHVDAMIANLTISGSGAWIINGGHVSVSAGTVRNCIIENGRGAGAAAFGGKMGVNVFVEGGLVEDCVIRGAKEGFNTLGGNVAMAGGRVRRCKILNGIAYSGANLSSHGFESRGGGVYISGGVLENCLVAGNAVGRFSFTGGIYLDGPGTVINCTVVGSTVSSSENPSAFSDYGVGIHVANSAGRVVNTVVYDNGGTAAKEFGTKNLTCYNYCASSAANESAAHWATITGADFFDYAAWTDTGAIKGLRPNRRSGTDRLIRAGTTWDEYLGLGATSATDLAGVARLLGKRLDIGCLVNPGFGLILFFR